MFSVNWCYVHQFVGTCASKGRGESKFASEVASLRTFSLGGMIVATLDYQHHSLSLPYRIFMLSSIWFLEVVPRSKESKAPDACLQALLVPNLALLTSSCGIPFSNNGICTHAIFPWDPSLGMFCVLSGLLNLQVESRSASSHNETLT